MRRQKAIPILLLLAALSGSLVSQAAPGDALLEWADKYGPMSYPIALVNERAGEAKLSVQRSGEMTSTVSVDYATSDGTATAGLDYIAQSGRLTFAPFETNKTVTIPILADPLVEGSETVYVLLSNPSSGA